MIGLVLLALWASLTVAYLLRQQLRGELSGHAASVPPLPWRGTAAPAMRSTPAVHTTSAVSATPWRKRAA